MILSPPTTVKKTALAHGARLSSPPTSSHQNSLKKMSKTSNSRRVSGGLTDDTTASAAEALGLSPKEEDHKMQSEQRSSSNVRGNGMLPTPAKTPKKRLSESAASISAIARNLFPVPARSVDDVMPSPRRNGRKKYTGFTLDSFTAEDEETPIQIFTDSQDRVPEVDLSKDNPFYVDGSSIPPEPVKRSKRRKINVPGEGEQTVEEAERREDGLVYVLLVPVSVYLCFANFTTYSRGKKIFRKFADEDESTPQPIGNEDDELDAELDKTVPAHLRGPLTRSSIKPRLLFPSQKQFSQNAEDEEEAITDIEEQSHEVSTPVEHTDSPILTPKAPKFAPASPPTTARATRASKKADREISPVPIPSMVDEDQGSTSARAGRARGGKVSPFDSWQRTKGGPVSQSKKREGEMLMKNGGEVSKRLRG